jgi:hypothetical protein
MADYDISNVPRRVVYAASGTGPYAFTFEILVQTDIAVYQNTTLLTLTTDYTVSINTNGTGSITLTASPTGSTITIVGDRAIERTTDFTTGGDLFANVLNDELDSLTIFDQQNAEAITRAIRAPETDPTTIDMVLPSATSRANKVLSFDANGDPEAVNTITSLNDVAAIVSEIVELSGVADAIEDLDAIKDDIETVSGLAADISALALKTTQIGVIGDDLASTGWSFDLGSVADATTGQTGVPDGYLVTVYDNLTDITTVATDIANVNAVGGSIANVNSVASELGTGGDVTVVSADLSGTDTIGTVATDIANVNSVAGSIASVNSVAAELGTGGDVTVVSADLTGTDTIGTVAGIAADVTTVAGISGDISAVENISANVTTVAGISANVTTVAGISGNVTTVAGISANVTTVAGNSSNVTTVATNIADVNTVANDVVSVGYLADIAGITPSDGQFIVGNGTAWVGENGSTVRNSLLPALASNAGKVLAVNTGATDVEWITAGGGGSGDVVGPASATDNAFARFDLTTGKLIQNSSATLNDTGAPTFVGSVAVSGTSSSGADVKLYEDTDNGSNYVALMAPASIASNVSWTLPSTDGTNGQALVTNGSGTLSWTTPGGSVSITNDTSTATDVYPAFLNATTGTASTIYTGNAKLLYKPSTGELKSEVPVAQNGIFVNAQTIDTNYTIGTGFNGMSSGPVTIASGVTVTVDSGSNWAVSPPGGGGVTTGKAIAMAIVFGG